ncbi:hypothetical protein PM082_023163 [Marasmius tenuissimus]|nr:hypothetical protein PM082_023163 [Marasmius tenuissimus]
MDSTSQLASSGTLESLDRWTMSVTYALSSASSICAQATFTIPPHGPSPRSRTPLYRLLQTTMACTHLGLQRSSQRVKDGGGIMYVSSGCWPPRRSRYL